MAKLSFNYSHKSIQYSLAGLDTIRGAVNRRHSYGQINDEDVNDTFTKKKYIIERNKGDRSDSIVLYGNFKLESRGLGSDYLTGNVKKIDYTYNQDNKVSKIKITKIPKQSQDISDFKFDDNFFSGNDTFTLKSNLPYESHYAYPTLSPSTTTYYFNSGNGNDTFKVYGPGKFTIDPGDGDDTIISYTKKGVTPSIYLQDGLTTTDAINKKKCDDQLKVVIKGIDEFSNTTSSYHGGTKIKQDHNSALIFSSNCPEDTFQIV